MLTSKRQAQGLPRSCSWAMLCWTAVANHLCSAVPPDSERRASQATGTSLLSLACRPLLHQVNLLLRTGKINLDSSCVDQLLLFFLKFFLLFKCILYIKHINNIEYFENQIIHKNLFNFYIHIFSNPENIINEYLILSITENAISNVEN